MQEAEARENEERPDECFEAVIARSVEPGPASELTEQESAKLECEECADSKDPF